MSERARAPRRVRAERKSIAVRYAKRKLVMKRSGGAFPGFGTIKVSFPGGVRGGVAKLAIQGVLDTVARVPEHTAERILAEVKNSSKIGRASCRERRENWGV